MNLSTEQLKSIEELAYRLVSPGLIAVNIGADETDLSQEIRTPGTQARNAFYRGFLQQTIETREAIIKMARNRSPKHSKTRAA